MKKTEYTGDGLKFFEACVSLKKEDVMTAMGIKSTNTFYGLYKKDKFTQEYKAAAAHALGKSVEEIFGDGSDAGNDENTNNNNTQLKSGTDFAAGTTHPSQNNLDELMINKILGLIDHANRNMEKIADSNLYLSRTIEQLVAQKQSEYSPKEPVS